MGVSAPQGGRTSKVWIRDSTPPVIHHVRGEAVRDESTIQVTLQLNEPGTIWCQAAEVNGSALTSTNCDETEVQDGNSAAACYFEDFVKGKLALNTVFRADAHEAFVDVDIEVNRIWAQDGASAAALLAETQYSSIPP